MPRLQRRTPLAALFLLGTAYQGTACRGGAPPVAPPKATQAMAIAVQVPGSRLVTASSETAADLTRLTARVAGTGTEEERARRVVRWVHERIAFTPARHTTFEALLDERNGNCYDHASLVIAMLRTAGIRARYVREINVQPPSEDRAASAREKNSLLYGREHNDHTWVEISAEGRWIPADSSLGLFGMREWLGVRVLRGLPNDYGMITPVALVTFEGDAPLDRTRDYLETALSATFPAVTRSAAWSSWRDDVTSFAKSSIAIFGAPRELAQEDARKSNMASALDAGRVHRMGATAATFRRFLADSGEEAGSASPLDFYLHPTEAFGSRYCFDPESRFLRTALRSPAPKESDTFDTRLLAEDVAFLREGLSKMYAGWPELLQHPTFDVEKMFSDWSEWLRYTPNTVTFAEGVLEPNQKLRQALTDFHFGVSGWTDKLATDPRLAFVEYQARLESPLDLATCHADDGKPFAPGTLHSSSLLGVDGRAAKVVTLAAHDVGDTFALTCGSSPISLTRRRVAGTRPTPTAPLPAYEFRKAGDVSVVTIRTFVGPPEVTRLLEQFVADYPIHAKSKLIVFDLRGNNGGDDHYVIDWLDRAHRGEWQAYTELDLSGGPLYPCNTWNAVVRQQILVGRADEPAAREERAALRAKWSAPRPPAHVLDPGRVVDHGRSPYAGRVVVLVDRFTRSAGESAAFMLHQALRAPLVGERTAGYLEYGNNRILVLPRTQLLWWYGTKRNYYEGNVEGVGLPADVYLERPDATVDELLSALRKL